MKKKLLLAAVILVFGVLLLVIGCNSYDDEPQPDMMESAVEIEPQPEIDIQDTESNEQVEQVVPKSAESECIDEDEENLESTDIIEASRGVIYGDVYYNGIAISRLFMESFIDVLGEPLGSRDEMWFFYEGLEIGAVGYGGEIIQMNAFEPHLGMFEINGESLDRVTPKKFITLFGAPYQAFFDDNSLRYSISAPEVRYFLILRFENSDDEAVLTSLSMGELVSPY